MELEDLVEHVFSDLDELRASQSDRLIRRKLIDRVFRRVHSVKGLAATTGIDDVTKTAHEFENLLHALRSGRVDLDDDILDLCENATETLSEGLELTEAASDESSHQNLFDQLQAAAARDERVADTHAFLDAVPSSLQDRLSDAEKQRLGNLLAEGNALFEVVASFNLNSFDRDFAGLKEKLIETGEVVSTSPAVNATRPDQICFSILYAALPEASFQTALSELAESSCEELVGAVENRDGYPSLPTFVRTDLEKLDHLISSTHELFRTTANAFNRALSMEDVREDARAELSALDDQIRNAFLSVEEELINLRMASIGPTLQRAVRGGRAAARKAGKRIHFEVSGAAVQVDKVVAEAIADPLVHLVRNAVDHGIENTDERTRAGKAPRGTIRIEATNEGSQSRVRVTDDGRGIDPNTVSEAAWALGLAERNSHLDLEKSLRLIFRPGFTTAAETTDLSGRGVGLDVVETAVEQVGGGLRVSSKPGEGATFEIVLPVSFGLLGVTVVSSSGNRYCIPTEYVNEVDAADAGSKTSLRTLLGAVAVESDGLPEVTCRLPEGRTVNIIVDDVIGDEEVLVRNLGRHAGRWQGVAGAAELRDGSVALVLDLPRLLDAAI